MIRIALFAALFFSPAGTAEVALPLSDAIAASDRRLDAGDAAGALALLERTREEEKEEARFHMKRGATLDLLRRHDEALDAHRRAISLAPGSADAFANYGVSLGLAGDLAGASASFAKALERKADHAEALANLGITLGRLGRLTEEIETLDRAVGVSPHEAGLRYNLGVALGRAGRATEEIAAYRAALSLQADFPAARENLAISLLESGRAGEAVTEFARLVETQPAKSDWRYGLGLARAAAGDFAGARACVEALKRTDWPSAERLEAKTRELEKAAAPAGETGPERAPDVGQPGR